MKDRDKTVTPLVDKLTALRNRVAELEAAAAASQERAARFSFAIEATDDGLWDWHIPTGTAFFSPRYYTMLGYKPGEMPASYRTWRSLLHPQDVERAERIVQEHIERKAEGFAIEFRLRTQDGGWKWILSRGKVVERDREGRPIRMVGTHTDITDRVLAQEQLRASEERYRNIVELAPDGIITVNLRGVVTSCNSAFLALSGFSKNEIVGKHFTRLPTLRLRDMPQYVGLFRSLVKGDVPQTIAFVWKRKDGTIRWGEVRANLMRQGAKIVGLQAIVSDVTEQGRAERLLQALNQAASAMAAALTPDEIFAAVGEAFKRLEFSCMLLPIDERKERLYTRYMTYASRVIRAAEKLTGLRQADYSFRVDDVETYQRAIRSRGSVLVHDTVGLMRDVVPGPVKRFAEQLVRITSMPRMIVAPLIAEDEVLGVLSVQSNDLIVEDIPAITAFAHQVAAAWRKAQLYEQAQQEIAERRRAEQALRESEERFRELAELLPEIVFETDVQGRLTFVNRQAFEITGYRQEDFDGGLNAIDLVVPSEREQAEQNMRRVIAGQVLGSQEYTIRRRDGTTFPGLTRSTPILRGGQPVGLRGVIFDISVRVKGEQEREQLQERVRQQDRMAAIGRLAGGVAHDFNNLLTAIRGYTSLVLDDLSPGDPIRADLEEVERASTQAAALTNQLLVFSRKQVLQPKLLNLNAVIGDMENMLRRLIGEDIELRTVLHASLEQVRADPGQIEQVIMNMAVNARDAMPQGGRLVFETAHVTLDAAYTRTHPHVQPGAYVMLAVSDTGCGMTEEVKAHLFEPFFTTKEAGKGTGLGLATVYGVVEQSGGHIEVYSELGVGTTFKLYLPRVAAIAEAREREMPPPTLPRGLETILLVEDEDVVRELAYRILERQGYTVLAACHPQEALHLHAQHGGTIHLLVTDVIMPGMDGQDLAKRLTPARPGMKVLFTSGYTDDAIAHHGVLEPGVAFLQKPFTPSLLAQKVRGVLDGA